MTVHIAHISTASVRSILKSLLTVLTVLLLVSSPSFAASSPKLSLSGQIGRGSKMERENEAQQSPGDGLSVFEVQSAGCVIGGLMTSAVAVATGTAATMVTGGVALPIAGEVVASFVTYFTAGCAVGAIVAPGGSVFKQGATDALNNMAEAIRNVFIPAHGDAE